MLNLKVIYIYIIFYIVICNIIYKEKIVNIILLSITKNKRLNFCYIFSSFNLAIILRLKKYILYQNYKKMKVLYKYNILALKIIIK